MGNPCAPHMGPRWVPDGLAHAQLEPTKPRWAPHGAHLGLLARLSLLIFLQEDEKNKPPADKKAEVLPTGRVVGIIKRNWRPYCGTLQPSSVTG